MTLHNGFITHVNCRGWLIYILLMGGGFTISASGSCILEYLMDEGSDTAVGDTSGYGNNADFLGYSSWVEGHNIASKHALYFDGDDYLATQDSSSLDSILDEFSLTAWIKADVDSTHDTIIWKAGAFRVWKQNANLMVTLEGVAGGSNLTIISGLLTNNAWHHVSITYDGQRVKGYLNGTWKRTLYASGNISTSNQPLYVGWYSSTPYYRGSFDNIRLYNHALSTSEIIDDMNRDTLPAPIPLTIVQDGTAAAAIIIPDSCPSVVQYAAEELQYHVEKATGVTLDIVNENNKPSSYTGLIYLGACDATAAAGIEGSYLSDNGYVVRNFDSDMFVANGALLLLK